MRHEYYSNGKLLLTGEYAVLDGAKALALPTIYGQSLTVEPTNTTMLSWKSLDRQGRVWFKMDIDVASMNLLTSTNTTIAKTALKLLTEAQSIRAGFLKDGKGYDLITQLTFPKDWGLGSSSTLITNIALWANIDPYHLLKNTFGGSGYDIACAQHDMPITYEIIDDIPVVKEVPFNPTFKKELFFVYLNKKQNSRDGILQYRKQNINKLELVQVIGNLTSEILACTEINTFEALLEQHEEIISKTLQIPPIKEQLFTDYPRAIKSLGAWGGDFILAIGNEDSIDYFRQRGFKTIIPYSEMIL